MTERLHFHFSLSHIGEGNGNPLHCSCLENSREGGAWWVAIYGVTQNRTRLKWLSSSNKLFRTAEEEVKNKACKPFLKPCHLPGMFHLCRYLCKLLFLSQNPRFTLLASSQWLTTLFKYNLCMHCALFFALSAEPQLLSVIPLLLCRHPEGMNYKFYFCYWDRAHEWQMFVEWMKAFGWLTGI